MYHHHQISAALTEVPETYPRQGRILTALRIEMVTEVHICIWRTGQISTDETFLLEMEHISISRTIKTLRGRELGMYPEKR